MLFKNLNKPKRVTLFGSFGWGNAGDEAIPHVLKYLIKNVSNGFEVDVCSRFNKVALNGIIGRNDKNRLNSISGQPLILCGGGIIEDKERASIFRAEQLIRDNRSTNLAFLGISVEPGVSYDNRVKKRIKSLLNKSILPTVYTRDYYSEQLLKSITKDINIETIGDLALWLKPAESLSESLPPSFIAISLTSIWKNDSAWRRWIIQELHNVHKEFKIPLVFVPMSCIQDDDRIIHQQITLELANMGVDCISLNNLYSPEEIALIYKKSKFVISMRLHGCVIAYSQLTPFIGISYHPKLLGFCYTVGLRQCLIPSQLPRTQSEGFYGYSFGESGIMNFSLLEAAIQSLESTHFSELDLLKQKSLRAINKMFLILETNNNL